MKKVRYNICKIILSITICLVSLSLSLIAQDNKNNAKPDTVKAYIGPYLDYNINIHSANFMQPDVDCPTCNPVEYGSSIGGGIAFGGLFEYLLYSNGRRTPMSLGVRLGYSDVGASFSAEEKIGNAININTSETAEAYSNHIFDANITRIDITPYFAYYFTESLVGNIGLNVGYMMGHNFDQREELARPDWVIFTDGSKERNRFDGVDIKNANVLQFGLLVGIGYEFPISKYSKIMPELQYNFNFNNVASDLDWGTSSLRLGAAIKFALVKPAYIKPEIFYQRDTTIDYKRGITEPEIVSIDTRKEKIGNDTLIIETYVKYIPKVTDVSAYLSYYAIVDGNKINRPTVVIEEFETTEYFPFLPIVYFKDGTFDLGNTKQVQLQQSQLANFDDDKLEDKGVFALYYNMLNILAKRMQKYPDTKITITGYSSGVNEDAKNKNIASQRANAVKDYIIDVWGIEPRRIIVNTGESVKRNPNEPSYADVVEESQKVQIYTGDLDLVMPVVITKIEKIATPPEVIFEIDAESEEGIKDYNLTLMQQVNQLRNFLDNANTNKLSTTKTWNVMDAPIPLLEAPTNVVLNVTDKANQTNTISQNVTIKQNTIKNKKSVDSMNIKIERYTLCLFDFDKATFTPVHRRILNEIKNSVKPNSLLFISGYADRTGEQQHNIDLAKKRIDVVNSAINPLNKINVELDVVGSTKLIYDNNTPEGRAFCRTVKIEIHTPSN
jgi:outer membrane protein OmpA-like peptidoglycan-associated protein